MTTTLSYDATTITPDVVDGWVQARESGNQLHEYIDGTFDYTLRPAGPRSGTITAVFATEADATACETLHREAPYIDVVSDDRDIVNGRYVPLGNIGVELDDETRDVWVFTVDWSEVVL